MKRVFYYHLKRNITEPTIAFRYKIKEENRTNKLCFSNVVFVEFLLSKTNSTNYDKKIASYELKNTLINNNECKYNQKHRDEIINLCKLFLENQYIEEKTKNEINSYLNELKSK